MKKHIILLINLFVVGFVLAQPGTIKMTPIGQSNLQIKNLEVADKFKLFIKDTFKLNVANLFINAKVFYAGGLTKPRFLHVNKQGVLHVIDYKANGKIYALPDYNNDGIADTSIIVVDSVNGHDFAFYNDAIYVAEERRILKCIDVNGDGYFENKVIFIDNIAEGSTQPGGGHRTRTIVFDSINKKMYLSIGSYCNVCREDYRAIIEEYNDDGTGKRTYATGTRNAVGMALHPHTNKLWANNNGSDNQGNDIPPEWVDIIRENGFYGYPFAHSNQVYFNFDANAQYQALKPITAVDSAKVIKMVQPAALVQAHSAPMQMEYFNLPIIGGFGSSWIMAFRGSWNRSPATGYKIVQLKFNNHFDTIANEVTDIVTGFLTDSVKGTNWGRPVGVCFNHNKMFITLDATNPCVISFEFEYVTSINKIAEPDLNIFPNPFTNQLNIKTQEKISYVKITNIAGQVLFEHNGDITQINTENLLPGVYTLQIESNNLKATKKIIKI